MAAAVAPRNFAFVFPMASGHVNPSLPIARALVSAGHKVHYLCREQMREAIEDTDAHFHADVEWEPEMFEGREACVVPSAALQAEYGLQGEPLVQTRFKLRLLALELQLPGMLRWLQAIKADAILYSAVMNLEGAYAGKVLGIPSVALLPNAGPGAVAKAWHGMLVSAELTEDDLRSALCTFAPHSEAVRRLNAKYGFALTGFEDVNPIGYLAHLRHSAVTLVTTCEALQDPVSPDLAQAYSEGSIVFDAVGALLDKEGACRGTAHRVSLTDASSLSSTSDAEVLAAVRAARAAHRPVVLVSMGTVITGDSGDYSWRGRIRGADGVQRGLTGCELCRGVWGGAFDAFGNAVADEGPLLVAALGPQSGALGDLIPPANAVCAPSVPQVDILKAGVELFLTHGGQNSFTEALANGVPLVVCPGFGDQHANAQKCESFSIGLQVARPSPELGCEAAAVEKYRADVSRAMKKAYLMPSFRAAAAGFQSCLQSSGGVPRAVEVVLEVAGQRDKAGTKAESWGGA